jgi:Domain of unknown function (DUF4407)
MTESLVAPLGTAAHDPFRPAQPDKGLSRLPRRLIGIREDILDWVPEERPRYTRLGIVLINTGLMATLSLFVALERVLNVPWIAILPIALFWGFLVLAIDSWMISSTHGVLGGNRLLMLVPRLALAVLIGTAIAEPLVLWIFHPAIHANVTQYRQDQIRQYASRLKDCNPENGSPRAGLDCINYDLPVKSAQEIQTKLDSLHKDRTALGTEIDNLAGQLQAKQAFAQDECAGVKRTGTSGQAGKGFRCDSAWEVADAFEKEIDLPSKRATLAGLDRQINEATSELTTKQTAYGTQLELAIAEKVRQREQSYGKIDIIEEARGLGRISNNSGFVLAANWLVRILLILVDSLPVLAKIFSGTTTYDLLVHRNLHTGQRIHGRDLEVSERRQHAAADVALSEIDHDREARINQHEERRRTAEARHDEDLEDEIDRLAARYAEEDPDDDR